MRKKGLEIKKIIFSALIIVQTIVLLAFSSYSWLVNNWSPSVTEQEIEIETTGGMVIGLTGEDGDPIYNNVSLNKLVGADSLKFKQVSSVYGKDFFWLDYTPTMEGLDPVLKKANAAEHGYIDVDFCLITESNATSKYVYLHHDTSIVAPLVSLPGAIRIAITFKGTAAQGSEDKSWIFGMQRENIAGKEENVDEKTMAALPTAEGLSIYNPEATAPQSVYQFDDYNGGRSTASSETDPEDENYQVKPDKVLHVMAPGEIRWINVKIWLEGGSMYCDEKVSGQKFGLILKFGSSNV